MIIEKLNEFTGHKDAIYAFDKLSDKEFFSASGDGLIVKWNSEGTNQGTLVATLPSAIYSLVHLDHRIIAGTRTGEIFQLDLDQKAETGRIKVDGEVFGMIEKGHDVAMVTSQGFLYLLDSKTLNVLNQIKASEKSGRIITISKDEKYLATGWSDNYIRIFGVKSLTLLKEFEAHKNSVFSLSYSPDGRYLVSGGRDATMMIFEAEKDYEHLLSIPAHWYTINSIEYSPSGQLFATGSRDKTVKIWDSLTFRLLKVIDQKFNGHSHSVNKILWLNEETLVSGGDDRKIMVWSIKKEG